MDEEIKAFLAALARNQMAPLRASTPQALRERPGLMQAYLTPAHAAWPVETVDIPARDGAILRSRLYGPQSAQAGVIVFFHGGGWVMGSVEGFHPFTTMLAQDTGCAVLSVEYRLAPERPYPVPLEDACDALQWACRHLGTDVPGVMSPLLVMGDSSGANLATVAARHHQRGSEQRRLDGQVLLYPVAGCRLDTPSAQAFAEGYFLTAQDMAWFWSQYVPVVEARQDPDVSPVMASAQALAGLPDTLLMTAQYDILRDEGQAYGVLLEQAGVPVSQIQADGVIHGFMAFATQAPSARRAYLQVVEWIKNKTTEKTSC